MLLGCHDIAIYYHKTFLQCLSLIEALNICDKFKIRNSDTGMVGGGVWVGEDVAQGTHLNHIFTQK